MAFVGNISGSNGTMNVAITGSLVLANKSDASFPPLPSDAVLFVSGNRGNGSGTGRGISGVSVFGGDVVISGTIAAQDGIGGFSPVRVLNDIALTGSLLMTASSPAPGATETALYVKSVSGLPRLYAKNGAASEFEIAAGAASSGIQGAVQFSNGSGGFSADAGNFFWDSTNGILKIANLEVTGTSFVVTSSNVTISDPVVLFGSGTKSNNSKAIIAFASGTQTGADSVVFGPTADGSNGLSAARLDVQNGNLPYTSISLTNLVPVRASKFEVGGVNTAVTSSDAQTIIVSGTQGITLQHSTEANKGAVLFRSDTVSYLSAFRDASNNTVINALSNTVYMSGSQLNLFASSSTGNANVVIGVNAANPFLQFQSGSGGISGATVSSVNNDLTVQSPVGKFVFLAGNNTPVAKVGEVTIAGIGAVNGIFPSGDRQQYLCGPNNRWANIYTGDLHLRNERGDYTLIEEEDFLSIRFNKTGKRYKFLLEPVPELDEK
jgi:hypothetical protein